MGELGRGSASGGTFRMQSARRTSFDALAKDYAETLLAEFDTKEKTTRIRQLGWWSKKFSGLSLVEIMADRISQARDKLGAEKFTRGQPHKDNTGQIIPPKDYKRSGATVNRYVATLSHLFSFAVNTLTRRFQHPESTGHCRRAVPSASGR
jgi:hypothetical protein